MPDTLRIALITDIHHGIDTGTKLSSSALGLLQTFSDWVNACCPELVVELGDRINDVDRETDLKATREVAHAFRSIQRPCRHLLGNHDTYRMSRADVEEAMQTTFASHSLDVHGYHLVFWNSAVEPLAAGGFTLTPDDLAWLQADLAATTLPSVIFTHLPLDNGSMLGNFYFERVVPNGAHYHNGAAARDIIERSGKVIACLAGHTHCNALHTIDGVHYITIHSLTESFTTHPSPTGAYGLLEIDTHLTVEVFGRDPALYRLPVKPIGYHWQNLDRDFALRPSQLTPRMAAYLASR